MAGTILFIIYMSNVKQKNSKEPRNLESEEQNKINKETRDRSV